MELPFGELVLRLGAAGALCAAIGLEREVREQYAGLRTHMLVGVGAALFTIVSAYGFSEFASRSGAAGYDPTRIAAQIVSGIGFLGAGAILRQGLNVRGLTTAASLWIVAAIGMAAGAGYYSAAALVTAMALMALALLRPVRDAVARRQLADVVVVRVRVDRLARSGAVLDVLDRRGTQVRRVGTHEEEGERVLELEVRSSDAQDVAELLDELRSLEGIVSVDASGTTAPGTG